jgi:predicted dehydrogenase
VLPALAGARNGAVWAIASRDAARAAAVAAASGAPRAYGDYADLLADPEVEAVYIALPNHLHREWTERAAAAGKHVLCEKPLACTAAEGEAMVAACRAAGVQLLEAVMYRFHPRMIRLAALIAEGAIGTPRALHAAFSFPLAATENYRHHPEFGGGALLDVGCYGVNAARWLMGAEPVAAAAHARFDAATGVDRALSGLLVFPDGATAHLDCAFDTAEHQLIVVTGAQGTLTAPLAFTAWRGDPTHLILDTAAGVRRFDFPPADPYLAMVEHFADLCRGRCAPGDPPEDAVGNLRTLDALARAARPGPAGRHRLQSCLALRNNEQNALTNL